MVANEFLGEWLPTALGIGVVVVLAILMALSIAHPDFVGGFFGDDPLSVLSYSGAVVLAALLLRAIFGKPGKGGGIYDSH